MTYRARTVLWFVMLAAVTLAVHGPRLHFGYFWDDNDFIVADTELQHHPFKAWSSPMGDDQATFNHRYYRPLPFFLLALSGRLAGFEPPVALNALHLAAMVFAVGAVFVLLRRHMRDGTAGFMTVLFAVFPTNVEAVAWLSALPDVLAFAFSVCFFAALEHEGDRPYPGLPALAFLALALVSKEGAVAAPLAALAWDGPRLFRRHAQARWRYHAPFWALTAGNLLLRSFFVAHPPLWNPYVSLVMQTVGGYFLKLVNPWPLSLLVGYRVPGWTAAAVLGLGLTLGIGAALVFLRSQPARLAFALVAAWLVLYGNIVMPYGENYLLAERYMLTPVFAAVLLAGLGLDRLTRPAPALAGVAVLTLLYGITSFQQYRLWADPRALLEDTLASYPERVAPHLLLAEIEFKGKRHEAAQRHAESAIVLMARNGPKYSVRYPRGMMQLTAHIAAESSYQLGDYAKAVTYAAMEYGAAASAKPLELAVFSLDHMLQGAGAYAQAVTANRLYPANSTLATLAVRMAILQGRADEAAEILRRSPQIQRHAAVFSRGYAGAATLPAAERGAWIYATTRLLSPSFSLFAPDVTRMTAQQTATVAQIAYQERMWSAAAVYFGRALAREGRPEWSIWHGLALRHLGRESDACTEWMQIEHLADPQRQAALDDLRANCAAP